MIKIAAVQFSAGGEVKRALKKAAQFTEVAASKGARIICFPELFAWPWFPAGQDRKAFDTAEQFGGPVTGEAARLAGEHSIAVICPFFERDPSGSYYNSVAAIDASGQLAGVYRKAHVPDFKYFEEGYYFSKGDALPVFELEGVKVAIQSGWDNFFPESFRALALEGAHLVFAPTAAAFASRERWLAMAVSHAIANGVYVMRVNRVGKEGELDFYGNSFCVRPDGELAAEPLGLNDGLLIVECDTAQVDQARTMWPFLEDRRPELYGKVAHSAPPTGESTDDA